MRLEITSRSAVRRSWFRDYSGILYHGGYDVGFLIYVSIVALIIILVGDKVAGSVLNGGYFDVDSYGNLEGVGCV